MRRLSILGSTGSIGTQALDLVERYPDRFSVSALVARSSGEKLFEQVRRFRPRLAGLTLPIPREDIPEDCRFCEWVMGPQALTLAAQVDCEDVLVAVVGMVGLESVLTAFQQHRRVLLANKEALVAGGSLVMEAAAREGENRLLPVDSEHSAIFQCLQGAGNNPAASLALTCSGGPFRTWKKEEIRSARREQALRHPNWVMGQKITVDSATLSNKALEMMEAKWLFGMEEHQIQVLIHPQSVVHSGVTFADGALLCQLGTPDMHLPILYAMAYPERLPTGGRPLNLFETGSLTFEEPDGDRFPPIPLMRACMRAGGAAGCVFNAANEEAVFRFLQVPDLQVGQIYDTQAYVLDHLGNLPAGTLEEVLEADRRARELAREFLGRL